MRQRRRPDDAKATEAARLYEKEGLNRAQVAERLDVDPSTVSRWLKGLMRGRGSSIDAEAVRRLRVKGKTWQQIADELARSKTGVRMAYRTTYGDPGSLQDPPHLGDEQARELHAMWESVPRFGSTGRALNSVEAEAVRTQLIRYREMNVPATELATVLGVSVPHIVKIISRTTEAWRYGRTCDWCGRPIPAQAQKGTITCGKYCRVARYEVRAGRRPRRNSRQIAAARVHRSAVSGESS